jgi:hypothetical protein
MRAPVALEQILLLIRPASQQMPQAAARQLRRALIRLGFNHEARELPDKTKSDDPADEMQRSNAVWDNSEAGSGKWGNHPAMKARTDQYL